LSENQQPSWKGVGWGLDGGSLKSNQRLGIISRPSMAPNDGASSTLLYTPKMSHRVLYGNQSSSRSKIGISTRASDNSRFGVVGAVGTDGVDTERFRVNVLRISVETAIYLFRVSGAGCIWQGSSR
jgi:hypothetical protein